MVRAEFGTWMLGTPRLVEKELGGGVLLDIGCYCLQFVCMVYNGEKPDSVHATGFLTEKGKCAMDLSTKSSSNQALPSSIHIALNLIRVESVHWEQAS